MSAPSVLRRLWKRLLGGFGGPRRPSGSAQREPLALVDELLAAIDGRARAVRRGAAARLVLRQRLDREAGLLAARLAAQQLRRAQVEDDSAAAVAFERDRAELEGSVAQLEAHRRRTAADAALLLEVAEGLAVRRSALVAERSELRLRLAADVAALEALRHETAALEGAVALEAARDELERAHVLAELYREEATLARGAGGLGPESPADRRTSSTEG